MYPGSHQMAVPQSSTLELRASHTLAFTEVMCPEVSGDEWLPTSEAMAACTVCASFRGDVTAEEKQGGGLCSAERAGGV